jgi:branched-chain amino acid aminotransferase
MNEHFFIYNNTYFLQNEPAIHADSRGLRYGDGLFETMRMYEGRILNIHFHFERFFSGMKVLQFNIPDYFSPVFFRSTVKELLLKNSIYKNARIRLTSFRGDGSIFDTKNDSANYIIETYPMSEKIALNKNGLKVDIFPDAQKSCDKFSNLKCNNYLNSVMAGLFAQKNLMDDAIILNAYGRICESAIANIFIVKDNKIYTPPLSEGCVAGTMRRWILEKFSLKNYSITEKKLTVDDLSEADELFLTNAIYPVRWVENFRGKIFGNEGVKEIFECVTGYLKNNKLSR